MLISLTWSKVCVCSFCLCQYNFSSFLLQKSGMDPSAIVVTCRECLGITQFVYQVSVLPGGLEVCS